MNNFWLILNKIDSKEMELIMMKKLGTLKSRVVGAVSYDHELVQRELAKGSLTIGNINKDIELILNGLEKLVSEKAH